MKAKLFSKLVASIKEAGKIKKGLKLKNTGLTKLFILLLSGSTVVGLFKFVLWLGYSIETAGLFTLPALIIFMILLGLSSDF